ncbi:MAG TPA: proton-conducting transporter membrane subunit [Anaerolineaceae bacterium]
MSTPVIWIAIPLAASLALLLLQRFPKLSLGLGATLLFLLAWLAWKIPIEHTFNLGPLPIRLSDTLEIAGRRFVLGEDARPLLILLFLLAAFWFIGALAADVNPFFAPGAVAMLGFFIAALSVQPFLYAALLIEIAVLTSIVMLVPPRDPVRSGVMRYLIFQTLAMPLVLFTGWMLTGVEAGNADINLPLRAGLLLGLGFALWLAVFPFHSGITLVSEQNHPYIAAFVFLLLQTAVLIAGVEFLDQFTWLRTSASLYDILRLIGVMMVFTGGVMSAFQNHLGRILGTAVLFETGFSLLAVSLGGQQGIEIFSMLFLPRALAMAVWALSLTALRNAAGDLQLTSLTGMGRRNPLALAGITLACLSLAGMPLLSGFPVKLELLQSLAAHYPVVAILCLLGMLGLTVAALRSLAVMAVGDSWSRDTGQSWLVRGLLAAGMLAILAIGLLPQVFITPLAALARSFSHLL